ncbi:hypothetical protein SAMN05444483_103105 [Salegentibacter echinorum]|uniref:Lipoprotein n=1 Tax=Salegentibacter echinorum TaxID=1073325 RepID=A0A1M5FCC1_SALEC|nr:hypothetical protein [Salegentibacter echinorum]SHF88691.1 hypothetical protein SAMN05444483_103105 [Salegentibacter echinorum]
MKKITIIALLLSVTLSSCSENDNDLVANSKQDLENACTATNPLEVKWMQDLITELNCGEYACKVSILKSEYEEETVFYIQMTDPLCNGVDEIILYNCTGKKLKEFTIEESWEFINSPGRQVEEMFSCNG